MKGAPLCRVNERLAGGQPGTLTAWLRHRQRQMLQRYCVQKLTRVRAALSANPPLRLSSVVEGFRVT